MEHNLETRNINTLLWTVMGRVGKVHSYSSHAEVVATVNGLYVSRMLLTHAIRELDAAGLAAHFPPTAAHTRTTPPSPPPSAPPLPGSGSQQAVEESKSNSSMGSGGVPNPLAMRDFILALLTYCSEVEPRCAPDPPTLTVLHCSRGTLTIGSLTDCVFVFDVAVLSCMTSTWKSSTCFSFSCPPKSRRSTYSSRLPIHVPRSHTLTRSCTIS